MTHVPTRARLPTRAIPAEDARVLVLLAHPALHRSRVNRRLAAAARAVPGVTVHDLYEAYPDHDVDVPHEQALLVAHPLIVFQHPFYWYSTPSLLKEWMDLVLDFGWAYGPGGTALKGKTLLSAITTGGREEAYDGEGFNRFTVRQFLAPIEQSARLCGMGFPPPFVVHGTHKLSEAEIDVHARQYAEVLEAYRDGRIPMAEVENLPRLNHTLEWLGGE